MSNATQCKTKRARRSAALSNEPVEAPCLPPYRLLWFESIAEFEALYDRVRSAIPPLELFDEIQLYFLTGTAWKLRRYRACKASLQSMIAKYAADPAYGPDSENVRILSDTAEMDRSAAWARKEMVKMIGDMVGRRSDRMEAALRAIEEAICAPFDDSQPFVPRTPPVAIAAPRAVLRRRSSKNSD